MRQIKHERRLILVLLLAIYAACGLPPDEIEAVGTAEEAAIGPSLPPFQQGSGAYNLVTMEAENFHRTRNGTTGHSWKQRTDLVGASGTGYMEALPNDGKSQGFNLAQATLLAADINFVAHGTHVLWIRAAACGPGSDSVHIAIDELGVAANWSTPTGCDWIWSKTEILVPSVGIHTLRIAMHKDGFRLDKLVLTTSATLDVSTLPVEESRRSPKLAPGGWVPGHYLKPLPAQWEDPEKLNAVMQTLRSTEQLRGLFFELDWGQHETTTGFDWSAVGTVLDRLANINNTSTPYKKSLGVYFAWRGFYANSGANIMLPPGLRGMDPKFPFGDKNGENVYRYLINIDTGLSGSPGYFLRLFDPVVKSRYKKLITSLANYIAIHPNGHLLKIVTTEESSAGTPTIPYEELDTTLGSIEALQDGQAEIWDHLRKAFPTKMIFANSNFTREFMSEFIPTMAARGLGLRTPNSHESLGLNRTTPVSAPGNLTYINGNEILPDGIAGIVPICLGVDRPDYEAVDGENYIAKDFPTVSAIVARRRDVLKANIIVWQGIEYFSNGHLGSQSVVEYLNGVVDPSGAGGLNRALPEIYTP